MTSSDYTPKSGNENEPVSKKGANLMVQWQENAAKAKEQATAETDLLMVNM
jgi:hypothetical protein